MPCGVYPLKGSQFMPAEVVQSQYEDLKKIADRFGRQAEAQKQLQQRIARSMSALQSGWQGKGSAAFFGEMNGKVLPVMKRMEEAFRQAQTQTNAIGQLIKAAEEDAAKPFKGGGRQVVGNSSNDYPTSQMSMAIPAGGLPQRPPPPPPPKSGDGSRAHGSEDRNWFERRKDDAVEALFARVADVADSAGMDNAARHMRHYLNNSGTELDVSPEAMLRDLPGLREKANQTFEYDLLPAINERIEKEFTGQPMRFPITTEWQGYYATKKESQDWFFAVGGFSYAQTADVIVTPNPDGTANVSIQHQLHVFDRYNWDKGKGVDIMGIRIGDEQLGQLHESGVAQEYEVWGKSSPQQHTYDYTLGSGGTSSGPQPWGEGNAKIPDPDRTTREGREQDRSPRRDDPTRNNDRER